MRKWLKRLGIGVGTLAALVLLLVAGVYGFSSAGIGRRYEVQKGSLVIPTDSAAIAWGRHIAVAIGKCTDCHGPDLGGNVMMDDPAFGTLYSTNLTRGKGGAGATYTDDDFVRAIRHGVRPDGSALIFMPSQEFTYMSDGDLAALIGYIRSLPAVDKEKPKTRIGPLARALYVAKVLPLIPAEVIDHKVLTRAAVPAGPTAVYGQYLARIGGCQGCHGEKLSGGPIPGGPPDVPPAANLTKTGLGKWTFDDFKRALREGTRPDGTKINSFMPYVFAGQMSDDEIKAVWLYLQEIPAAETGAR